MCKAPVALIGLNQTNNSWCFSYSFLGYLKETTTFCLYTVQGNPDHYEPQLTLAKGNFVAADTGNTDLYLIQDLIDEAKLNKLSRVLFNLLQVYDQSALAKIINNIPKQHRPAKPNYTNLSYELKFITTGLFLNKDLLLVDRYGERTKQIIKQIHGNKQLKIAFKTAGYPLPKLPNIRIYKVPKALPLATTPLPYRVVSLNEDTNLIDLVKRYNQVPLVGGKKLLSIIKYARKVDEKRFEDYIEHNTGIDISQLSDQEACNLLTKQVITPFYLKLLGTVGYKDQPKIVREEVRKQSTTVIS